MKPITFKESNKVLNKPEGWTDDQCSPLPVFTDGQQCISCWKMTFSQRIKALLFGKVWLSIYSGQTQPPVWVDACNSVFIKPE